MPINNAPYKVSWTKFLFDFLVKKANKRITAKNKLDIAILKY